MIGTVGQYGALSRLGDAGGAGAPTPANGYYVDVDGAYWYYYAGGSITIVRQPGNPKPVSISVSPGTSAYAAIYAQIAAHPENRRSGPPSVTTGSVTAGAQSGVVNTGVSGSVQIPTADATQVHTGGGGSAWLQTVTSLTSAFMPLVQLGVDEIKQGGSNTLATLQGNLASKQAKLARTTNPGQRAKLQSEIQSIKGQIASYQQMLADGGSPTGQEQYLASTRDVTSTSTVPWSALALFGVPVVGGLLWWAASSKPESHATAA